MLETIKKLGFVVAFMFIGVTTVGAQQTQPGQKQHKHHCCTAMKKDTCSTKGKESCSADKKDGEKKACCSADKMKAAKKACCKTKSNKHGKSCCKTKK
ncbi:hypothetical protein [Riemerella columbipharyngis]|uniref:Uncharacterized protein n=1 Tax=Riemerella columbipharyngis TaxID=1071918 RepID=A0A1G7CL81_9FLAO|nr:hypothetical protein [Riemerella columbipharyngis]SDE39500.1 hypothetical protein SAMN05421544_10871 [Riemerella columbipharyngis]